MMRREIRHILYRGLLAVWILLGGCALSSAYASPQTQSASWGYAPVYSTGSSSATYTPKTTQQMSPTYQFRSTSVYLPEGSYTSYTPMVSAPFDNGARRNGPRRDMWDDEPDDEGIGEVADPAPVGSPLCMIVMALLYLIYQRRKLKKERLE